MKDFDQARAERVARDRTFQIGGEVFKIRSGVRPEVLAGYEDMTAGETPALETLGVIDGIILGLVEPENGSHERWRSLRAREEDPVTLEDMRELVAWLVAEQTGRPTVPPSPSGRGRVRTATSSTADSSSPAASVG